MTGPTTGYPDWHPTGQWRGTALVDTAFNIPAGNTSAFGLFSVSQFASAEVRITTNAGGGTCDAVASDTGAFLSGNTFQEWIVRINTEIWFRIPWPRDFLEIDLTAGALAAWVGNITIQPSNHAVGKTYFPMFGGGVSAQGPVIAAGLKANYQPQSLMPGPAHVWMLTGAGGIDVQFNFHKLTPEGALGDIFAQWRQIPAVGLNDSIELPETAWVVQVWNNTGGNQFYYIAVTPRTRMN